MIAQYITEFKTIFDGEPWYGKSLMAVLDSADPQKVFNKPNRETHSAYEILEHVYAWRALFVKRLNGDSKSNIAIDSSEDWSTHPPEQKAETWHLLVDKLEQNQAALLIALGKWSDEQLDEPFAGTKYSLRIFINGHIQHDIYHIGQIALALKSF